MPVGAALGIAGAGLVSGAMGASASRSAGNQVAGATDRAAELENQRFQQYLQLQMPGYRRAEDAAGLYGRALGIPSMTGQRPTSYQTGQGSYTSGGQPAYPTGQPGATASYGVRPMMRMVGEENGSYSDFASGYQPERPMTGMMTGGGEPQINGGPGDGFGGGPAPDPGQVPGQSDQQMIYDQVRGSPGYQNQLDEGLKAIDRAAPLTGGMYSGRRMKALESHGQQTFGSFYDSWLNRVGGIAGQAPQITSNIGTQGAASVARQGGLMVQGATAQGNARLNSANAWSGAIGDAVGGAAFVGGRAGWF